MNRRVELKLYVLHSKKIPKQQVLMATLQAANTHMYRPTPDMQNICSLESLSVLLLHDNGHCFESVTLWARSSKCIPRSSLETWEEPAKVQASCSQLSAGLGLPHICALPPAHYFSLFSLPPGLWGLQQAINAQNTCICEGAQAWGSAPAWPYVIWLSLSECFLTFF